MEKKYIGAYVKEIKTEDLILAVKDAQTKRETGLRIAERTVTDDIYDLYMMPINGKGVSSMFASQDVINRELAERFVNDKL